MRERANEKEQSAAKAKLAAGKLALADLIRPVRWQLLIGRVLGGLSAALAIMPL